MRRSAGLKAHPADVVIIPPQWRARDIILEMEREGIGFKRVLIEHEGALIDYTSPMRIRIGSGASPRRILNRLRYTQARRKSSNNHGANGTK